MDIFLVICVGLFIFGVGLYSKPWAGLASFFGFFIFWMAAISGILGFPMDFHTAAGVSADINTGKVFGQIAGTYLLGAALGWLPHFVIRLWPDRKGDKGVRG